MEQERSEKLAKHLKHIREMVNYDEISGHLLTCSIISSVDHLRFLEVANVAGNQNAMDELVQVLMLRRGGFEGFVCALRINDYNWMAEQLDPEPVQNTGEQRGLFNGILKRKSRRTSEARMSAETVFTSYRQSFPMDLSSSCRSLNHCHQSDKHFMLTKSFDSLNIQNDLNSNPSSVKGASALLLNIPGTNEGLKDVEVVSKIADEINFPLSENLTSLKRISVKSKSPKAKNRSSKLLHLNGCKNLNVKLKFKSKDARDRFVERVNSTNDIGGIKVVPLDSKSKSDSSSSGQRHGAQGWFKNLLKRR